MPSTSETTLHIVFLSFINAYPILVLSILTLPDFIFLDFGSGLTYPINFKLLYQRLQKCEPEIMSYFH